MKGLRGIACEEVIVKRTINAMSGLLTYISVLRSYVYLVFVLFCFVFKGTGST